MLHRLILKVRNFQLPTAERFRTVVKNILEGHHAPPSNRVKTKIKWKIQVFAYQVCFNFCVIIMIPSLRALAMGNKEIDKHL